jgi:hypothetical protein
MAQPKLTSASTSPKFVCPGTPFKVLHMQMIWRYTRHCLMSSADWQAGCGGAIRLNQSLKVEAWMSLYFSRLLPNPVAYGASELIGSAVGDFGIKFFALCRGTCRHQDQKGQNEKDRFHLNSIPGLRFFGAAAVGTGVG